MKKRLLFSILIFLLLISGCANRDVPAPLTATTYPVYELTQRLCSGTDLTVSCLISESVSCLHNYSLQVSQMRTLEQSEAVILSGAGLEELWEDSLRNVPALIDVSDGIDLMDSAHEHEEGNDHHDYEPDPHIWLSPINAKIMATNICKGLCSLYPEYEEIFRENLSGLSDELDALQAYGEDALSDLSCRQIITFHDGFTYFAEAFDITILESIEEESGSEASAADLIALIELTREHDLPAIFTEVNGSTSAAQIVAAETGTAIYPLDMGMSSNGYFEAMYHNIDTLKEALK